MLFKKKPLQIIRQQLLDQEILKGDKCMKSVGFPRDEFLILITTNFQGEQHPVRIQSGEDGVPFTPFFQNSEAGKTDARNIAAQVIKNMPEGLECIELYLYKIERQVEKYNVGSQEIYD